MKLRLWSNLFEQTEEQHPSTLTPDTDAELCLTAEQRQAKLRRVERIRERVMKRWDYFGGHSCRHLKGFANWWSYPFISAIRESLPTNNQLLTRGERKDTQVPSDYGKERPNAGIREQRTAFILCFPWTVVIPMHKNVGQVYADSLKWLTQSSGGASILYKYQSIFCP